MDVRAIKGKSFISADPFGQVDWSWAFWFGFYFALPVQPPHPPTESTLLLQLLQTEKVMGLRFCPDKGVRTLSLLLTPLSHHWEWESVVRALRDCQSKHTTQFLFKTICHWTPTGLFVSDPKTDVEGLMDSVAGRNIHHLLSYQMQARDCRSSYSWIGGVGRKLLKGLFVKPGSADCQHQNKKLFQIAAVWLSELKQLQSHCHAFKMHIDGGASRKRVRLILMEQLRSMKFCFQLSNRYRREGAI